jgi:integrase
VAKEKSLPDGGGLGLRQSDHEGQQPYWPDNLMKRYIKPVARQANGIYKNIGWHTFRHTFGTLLKANGEDVKTVQELLRHANSRITLDVYTQAVNSHKRAAQSKVVRMMVPAWVRERVNDTRFWLRRSLMDPISDPDLLVT